MFVLAFMFRDAEHVESVAEDIRSLKSTRASTKKILYKYEA